MPLQLNISNSLAELSNKLSSDLKTQPVSVFQPQYIVTQTAGMNNWLKLQIAGNNGIAANTLFVSPNDIFLKVYYLLGGRYPNQLTPANLSWLLYKILGSQEFTFRFPHIASYFGNEGVDKDLKRMALAEKVADLFDQYQIYRHDWIEEWNSITIDGLSGDKWQQFLWVKAKEIAAGRLPDKSALGNFIKEALKDKQKRDLLNNKIPSLYVFGLSVITQYHLNLLYEISKGIHITFYLLNPAPPVYWFEDRSEKQLAILKKKGLRDLTEEHTGNALLTSWGRIIQDTFMMLFQNEELLNNFEEVGTNEPGIDTLLHKIQHDVYNGNGKNERAVITNKDLKDETITISSCYTVAREIEVLYNYLVHLVDKKKEALSPRDIVVMVTDIDAYAPYIKAVFKNAPYKFHFTIADESFENGDTMVGALTAILKMNRQNFKSEEVLQLLDSGYIRRRFSISNLELIRRVVDAANIRFGMKGRTTDDTRFVSWEYGIKRILYGICMSGGDEYTDPENESLFPLDLIEGSESQEVIRFCQFVQVLMDSINERDRARTIAEWVSFTEQVIQNMICEPEEEIEEDYVMLQEQLKKFNAAFEFMDDKIAYDIFTHSLLQSISGATRSGSFGGGGITFCSLIPMRSIPFKIVALLGLNFDKFPRRQVSTGFNLMEKSDRRRGDRNVKDGDKHLFLETILSAKEYLYLSYLGQSAKDNTTLPPSALVDELVDYIEAGCEQPKEVKPLLIIKHPIHSFSSKYNRALPGYYTYLDNKKIAAAYPFDEQPNNVDVATEEITIGSLISFFKNPFEYYYNKVLNIRYGSEDVLLSDTEVFELDSLQKWQLRNELIKLPELEVHQLKVEKVKKGELPLKFMADIAINEVSEEIETTKNLFIECVGSATEASAAIEIEVDSSLIKGPLNGIYDDKIVMVCFSKTEDKYLIEAYLKYLIATAAGLNLQFIYISKAKEDCFTANPLTPTDALNRLQQLVQVYKRGSKTIVPVFPHLGIKPKEVDELTSDVFNVKIEDLFNRFTGPCTDEYLVSEYRFGFFEREDVVEEFKANAALVIKPLAEIFPDYYN